MEEKILKATHQGEIIIGDIIILCAVLEDGTRVIREGNVAKSLGSKGSATYWEQKKKAVKRGVLPGYVHAKYLQPFINEEIRTRLLNSIYYKPLKGSMAIGIEASLYPEICHIWIKAREKRVIPQSQEKTAQNAETLLKGFAVVGITALVDEATGYQEVRDRLALQKILEKYIAKELRPWVKTFPDEYYEQLFKLRGWQYKPLSVKRPKLIGKLTNDIIYDRLAPGVRSELQRITPKDERGRRKYHFHRRLTEDIGHPKLREHISNVITLMRAVPAWSGFKRMLERSLPKKGQTFEIPFEED